MGLFKKKVKEKQESALKLDIIKAKDWIILALCSSGYPVDTTLESLKEIDRFFDEQCGPNGLLSEQRGNRLFAIGAYIGEVIISTYGGEWICDDEDPMGEVNASIRLLDGTIIWPIQRAVKRYQNGAEDSIYAYACALNSK